MRVKTIEWRGGRFSLRIAAALALMLAATLLLASCGTEEEQGAATTPEGEAESEGPASGVVVSDITDNPSEYLDATVTISGEVNDIAAPQAFTIGGEDFLGTEELLIVGAQQLPDIVEGPEGEEVGENDIVQITGTVQQFDSVTDLEDEVGNEIDDQLFEDYEGEPVVVAEEIFLTPRAERAGEDVPVSLADITDDPEEYFGQTLTADGVVAETLEPNAFVLVSEDTTESGEPAADLVNEESVLVVSGEGAAPNLTESQNVQVTGTFQEFELTTAEDELGVDLQDDLYADWEGRPAIVAQQIQQMQGEQTTSQ